MGKGLYFISLLIVAVLLLIIGISLTINTFLNAPLLSVEGFVLMSPFGVGLVLVSIFVFIHILNHPLNIEKIEKRDIPAEKKVLGRFVLYGTVFYLFDVTLFLIACVVYFSKHQPALEFYMIVAASAASGAFWAMGLNECYSFQSWYKYGNDFSKVFDWTNKEGGEWYPLKSTFIKNLHLWKKIFISALASLIVIIFVMYMLIDKGII